MPAATSPAVSPARRRASNAMSTMPARPVSSIWNRTASCVVDSARPSASPAAITGRMAKTVNGGWSAAGRDRCGAPGRNSNGSV